MRLAAHALLLCAGTISAQNISAEKLAEAAQIADLANLLEPHTGEQPLPCKVKIVKPILDYAFRFETGYSFQVPLNLYREPGHTWKVLSEVTPQGGKGSPVYFLKTLDLLKLDKIRSNVVATGGYLVGEGRYNVRWLLLDDLGRACRTNWRIEADRKGRLVDMPPNTVALLSLSGPAQAQPYTDSGTPMRLTVLLDAAPLHAQPIVSELRNYEQSVLFNGLIGLLERLPTSSVRLIMFNLELQQELLRRDNFTLNDLDSVAEILKGLELGAVRLDVLEKPKGHVDLLTRLLNDEIRSASPSDAVVFLGPQERYFDKVPYGALDAPGGNQPRFFSVQFVPAPRWVPALAPADGRFDTYGHAIAITASDFDTVSRVVKRLKGKAVQVWTADEFERAIQAIELSRR
jgi:hypothetical protein